MSLKRVNCWSVELSVAAVPVQLIDSLQVLIIVQVFTCFCYIKEMIERAEAIQHTSGSTCHVARCRGETHCSKSQNSSVDCFRFRAESDDPSSHDADTKLVPKTRGTELVSIHASLGTLFDCLAVLAIDSHKAVPSTPSRRLLKT